MRTADDIIAGAIAKAAEKQAERALKLKTTTVTGVYKGVDSQGKGWALLPGADSPTPLRRMSASAEVGDTVSVTIGGGRAVMDANVSNPSAGAKTVDKVGRAASSAQQTADVAASDAKTAIKYASSAKAAASDAETAAASAQSDATSAAESASSAMKSAGDAISEARRARSEADDAAMAAADAWSHADAAATAAGEAWQHADEAADAATEAQATASAAGTYANAALGQLGIVQDVVGVLDWVVDHGRFERTRDESVQPYKVYYAYDPIAMDYAPVAEPMNEDMASYFELVVDEAMQGFIMKHLAVTDRGLWVVPSGIDAQVECFLVDSDGNQVVDSDGNPVVALVSEVQYSSGYKVLLANDGMYVYDPDGILVAKFGENIEFSSLRSQYIGNEDAYVVFTPARAGQPAQVTIGGNVKLGSSRTLSQVLSTLDSALQPDDVTVSQNPTETGYDVTIGDNTFSLVNGSDGQQGPQGPKGDAGAAGPQGPEGAKGDTGAQGRSVTSVRTQWYLSTSDVEQVDGEWSYAPADYVDGRWYWRREEVGWDDAGTASTTHTAPVLDSALNQAYSRIASAEVDIDGLEGSVALKANAEDVYTKQAANALLEVKADKDTLVSEINASADTVRIRADKIDIRGAVTFGALAEDVTDKLDSIDEAVSDAAGLSYDNTWTLADGTYSFAASARRGGVDITDALPDEFFTWHLRTEDGTESFIGTGKAKSVPASSAGYHATVVGGLEEQVEFAVATSSGDQVVDEQGRRLIGVWNA